MLTVCFSLALASQNWPLLNCDVKVLDFLRVVLTLTQPANGQFISYSIIIDPSWNFRTQYFEFFSPKLPSGNTARYLFED
jgi:hypothetical protein